MKSLSRKHPLLVAIIGAAEADAETLAVACEAGRLVAENGGVVITGGRTGVMEAASMGAQRAGGLTIGVLPGTCPDAANEYVTIPLATGLGHSRNAVIAQSASVLIAIAGGYGTLSEIALALKMKKPVFGLKTRHSIDGVVMLETAADIVDQVFKHE